jgi:hypothetical protein
MLPSAVNDTMRDMMAQIRDVGDGIRGGTYTMTAPVITGGSISGASVSATSITDSGNLTFTGTGNRITGDFSNATVANRVMFQTSTTNGATPVSAIPNGTGTQANFTAYNASDPTNASVARMSINTTTDMRLDSSITGTGTYLPLTMWTGGSERLRIDTSGNVLVGTTSSGGRLTVKQSADAGGGGIRLERQANTNNWQAVVASTDDLYLIYNGTDRGYFSNSTGAYTSISDKTLKKDVEGISLGLNAIKSLRPVEYLMLDDVEGTKKHLGFLAQEVQEVIPSSVSEMQSGKLGIDKSEIIPVLVKAMQEQQTMIETLTIRLNALEGK